MIDENGNETTRVDAGSEAASERVGFCQDCGKGLTQGTIKTVGSAVFCEPCLEKRLGGTPRPQAAAGFAGTSAAGYAASASAASSAYTGGGVSPEAPKPGLAAVLGLIPGAGACYNGQYAKGMIHLVIAATLMELTDHFGIFCLFVIAWEIYMSLEAYHTAKARLAGMPLPNPFGFNEMGERMGFGKGFTGAGPAAYAPPPPPAGAAAGPVQTPVYPASESAPGWGAGAGAGAVPPPPPYGAPQGYPAQASYAVPPSNWAGYVHPGHFAGAPPATPAAPYTPPTPQQYGENLSGQVHAQAMRDAGAVPPPYGEPFNVGPVGSGIPPMGSMPSRFPVGAIWLIGAGALVLLANVIPGINLSGTWLLVLLFSGLSVWTFTRKLGSLGGVESLHGSNVARLACILRGPVILMVLAVMFGLQAAHVATLGQSWPLLVIAFGVMLILERTVGSSPAAYSGTWPGAQGYAVPPASVVPPSDAVNSGSDAPKGGQG